MAKEDLLDRHIHLHIHEIMLGRWLRPKRRIQPKIFSKSLCGLILGASIVGAVGILWLK